MVVLWIGYCRGTVIWFGIHYCNLPSILQRKLEVVGRGVTGLDQSDQLPEDGYLQFMSQQQQLSMGKKFYEFYNAPITKFWLHTLSFIAFLLTFTYVVLVSRALLIVCHFFWWRLNWFQVEMGPMPSPAEWVIVSCVFTMFLEKVSDFINF